MGFVHIIISVIKKFDCEANGCAEKMKEFSNSEGEIARSLEEC